MLWFRLCILALHMHSYVQEKHSKLKSITDHSRSNRVSLLHWNTRDITRSRFTGETQARSVTCTYLPIPTEKARPAISTRVMLCFYLFQMAKTICQLVAWLKDTRVSQKSVAVGRVGRSVGRESRWSVWSLKLMIIFGRNSFVLRPHLNVKN